MLKVDLSHARPRRPGAVPLRTLTCVTSGLCLGYLQADLVVVPAKAAAAFQEFCLASAGDLTDEPTDPAALWRDDLAWVPGRLQLDGRGEAAGRGPLTARDLAGTG